MRKSVYPLYYFLALRIGHAHRDRHHAASPCIEHEDTGHQHSYNQLRPSNLMPLATVSRRFGELEANLDTRILNRSSRGGRGSQAHCVP
ncbi:hypothetical protein ABIC60_004880 [Phyllobacterium ifriqiyense]